VSGSLLAALAVVVREIAQIVEARMDIKNKIESAAGALSEAAGKGADALEADVTIAAQALARLAGQGRAATCFAGVIASTETATEADREGLRVLLAAVTQALGDA
jgi:hypothetical protein